MPKYLSNLELYKELYPFFIFPLLVTIVVLIIVKDKKLFLPLFSFALFGAAIGKMVGLSRTPVTDSLIPALLTFLGGMFIYIIGIKKVENQGMIALCVLVLTINIMVCTSWASQIRVSYENLTTSLESRLLTIKQDQILEYEKLLHENNINKIKRRLESQ